LGFSSPWAVFSDTIGEDPGSATIRHSPALGDGISTWVSLAWWLGSDMYVRVTSPRPLVVIRSPLGPISVMSGASVSPAAANATPGRPAGTLTLRSPAALAAAWTSTR
jgi:hypothetical protein